MEECSQGQRQVHAKHELVGPVLTPHLKDLLLREEQP